MLVGTAVADRFVLWRFGMALIVALALQVAVNYANDLFDANSGVDGAERLGPRRVVAAGIVAPAAMRRALVVALAVAAVAGLVLAAAVGWELVLVGLASGLAALGYSGGRTAYASRGLGELFVFVFFGLVATVGSQYVQDETWRWVAVLAAVPIGLVAVAILVVNNLRDIPTDAPAGKRTLAVRIGDAHTRRLFVGLVGVALLADVAVALALGSAWPLLALAAAPLAWGAVRPVLDGAHGRALIVALEQTGRFHLVHGVLLALGLAVGS